jgi:hypothetical protein
MCYVVVVLGFVVCAITPVVGQTACNQSSLPISCRKDRPGAFLRFLNPRILGKLDQKCITYKDITSKKYVFASSTHTILYVVMLVATQLQM